jgi:uncharacterized protein (DUF1778 family)
MDRKGKDTDGRGRGGGRRATSQFNLKFLPGERELLERAVARRGARWTLTSFIIDAATTAARKELGDHALADR